MSDQPKPPEGLVDRLRHFERHQIESGDEYGAEVLHRAAEEIARLTRERDEARAAGTQIKELERLIVERRPVWYAYVESVRRHDQELQGCIKERDSLLARVDQLEEERDMARAKIGEVSRDNDRLRSVLFAYRANNYRLRELLEEARNMIVTNWLVLGEYQRPREVSRLMTRIRTELAGSPEPPGLSEAPPVSAMRWVADTVERGDSELDCSLEEVNAVIRWLRAWAERLEETKDNE